MKPVAIFRHSANEGPGYFAIFLEQQGIPWQLIAVDEAQEIPSTADQYAGLCFMGGPMSVNDPLPWIDEICALIRDAVAKNIPVIGHCLGGQLISKALGGTITANPIKEIGWGSVSSAANPASRHWLGEHAGQPVTVFHWHGDTFSRPEGAEQLLANPHCSNQMFALGPHLAMQCHVEMTPEMIVEWCAHWAEEANSTPNHIAIQSPQQIQAEITQYVPGMRQLAEQIYSVWVTGLARN
jgi:GMP synthase-like glutamine amidotransferase